MIYIYKPEVGLSHKRGLWIGWIEGLRFWFMTKTTVYWLKVSRSDTSCGSYKISR